MNVWETLEEEVNFRKRAQPLKEAQLIPDVYLLKIAYIKKKKRCQSLFCFVQCKGKI